MNETNLDGYPKMANLKTQKSGVMASFLVLIFVILGFQDSIGQKMIELGELKSAEVMRLVQTEMDDLEIEIKQPGSGVITTYNEQLIKYYSRVLSGFDAGEDFKEALKKHPGTAMADFFPNQPGIENPSDTGQDIPSIVPTPSEYLQLLGLISNLDLSDNSTDDLDAIFQYWRTLKNQP